MMLRLVVILSLCLAAGAVVAQPQSKRVARPAWAELTVEQQKVLAPLKTDWDALDRERKLKWIGIAKRYPAMKPQEQERVQRRMQAWAKLTPQQRRQARETYKQLAKQPPETRGKLREKWAEYQRQQPTPLARELPAPPVTEPEAAPPAASEPLPAKPESAADVVPPSPAQ
jgi:hypothetical protein